MFLFLLLLVFVLVLVFGTRVFGDNSVVLGLLQSVSYIKPIPTHEKIYAVGKSGPNATFNLFFLGLGWPWVGEFVGFIIIFICFPTQQNLVNRNHPLSVYWYHATLSGNVVSVWTLM